MNYLCKNKLFVRRSPLTITLLVATRTVLHKAQNSEKHARRTSSTSQHQQAIHDYPRIRDKRIVCLVHSNHLNPFFITSLSVPVYSNFHRQLKLLKQQTGAELVL